MLRESLFSLFFDPRETSEEEGAKKLAVGGAIFMVLQALVTVVLPAPYGRYAEKSPYLLKREAAF